MDDEQASANETFWDNALKTLLVMLCYMPPMFWLWSKTDFPKSFGIRITAHGKGAVLEEWWYSYLLLERHHVWDILTFAYMWAPLIGFVGYLLWTKLGKRDHGAAAEGTHA